MVGLLRTKAEFLAAIASPKLSVVDFFATWCGPCRVIAPTYESYAARYTDAQFFKVDVDQNQEAAQYAGVTAMPTFMLYRSGTRVGMVRGADPTSLERAITDNLQQTSSGSSLDPQAVQEFVSTTGASDQHAVYFLQKAKGDTELAINMYFDNPDEQIPTPAARASTTTSTTSGQSVAKQAQAKPTPGNPRISTFSSMNRDDDDYDDSAQTFYAGGEKSGIAVSGPPKMGAKDLFDAARKAGGVEASQQLPQKPQYFAGQGYKLGSEDAPAQSASTARTTGKPQQQQQAQPQVSKLEVTFWRNGVSVSDGVNSRLLEIRDPQRFLDAMSKGEVPDELAGDVAGRELDIALVDNRDRDYSPPKPVIKSFSGEGHKLGTHIPVNVVSGSQQQQQQQQASASRASTSVSATTTTPAVPLDETQPTTKLQIRLADGTRLVAKFNHTQRVSDIRRFVEAAQPSGRRFVLMTSFPNKELADESQTLAEANLLGATVMQKFA